jgi:protein OPY2
MEDVARTIFRRCVECPDGAPACPDNCPDGYECSMVLQSCSRCQRSVCAPMGGTGSSSSNETPSVTESSGGPNAGAIAGGVIGGLIFFAVVIWLIWKFGLKSRRERESQYWSEQWQAHEEKEYNDNFTMQRDARASTHTVASMASTVLTRASNIIQIAYIPGVTNRSGPASPQPLVPPVPPIPAATSPHSPHGHNSEADLHFLPGDIRDSTFTDGRSSFAPSMARDSVASTVYRSNAVISPQPAQTVLRGKANVVSVNMKGSADSTPAVTPGFDAPMMPAIPAHLQNQQAKIKSPGGSVRSVAQLGKPMAINVTRKKSSGDLLTSPDSASSGSTDPIHAALAAASSTRMEDARSPQSSTGRSPLVDQMNRSESDVEDEKSPFSDAAQQKQIAEAVRRASKTDGHRSKSPFSDENAVSDR